MLHLICLDLRPKEELRMLKITKLSKSFNKESDNELHIFNDFNLEIEENKCTAIIGPNGCGKSTLLNIVSGSIMADQGEIMLDPSLYWKICH